MAVWEGCFVGKKSLSERDICTKYITPPILEAGWLQHQFREEVKFTDCRVMVRGKLAAQVINSDAKDGAKRKAKIIEKAESNDSAEEA